MKGRRTPPQGLERRDLTGEAPVVTDSGKIRGLAIPFDEFTTIGYGPRSFRERVAQGALTKTLREADTVYLDNHDPAKPIARKSAGTLDLIVTSRGLEYEASPADTSYARDLVENVRAGNIQGNSFGFEVVKDSWAIGDDGIDERTLHEIKLPEVSACTFPAYPTTDIGMRESFEHAMECRDRFYEDRAGNAPYGDVAYADPGYQKDKKKRYPINTKEHVKAAWSYINKAKNAAAYTAAQLAKIKAKIKAAAKKFGITISSDRSFADFELRGYDPERGFRETPIEETPVEERDDPDGLEWAAMQEAIEAIDSGDYDSARVALQNCLDETKGSHDEDSDGDAERYEDSSGMVAHTTPAGASVPVRALEEVYELVRSLPPTTTTNEALKLLEPLLDSTPAEEREADPKPGTSTSGIEIDSDEGLELQRRMRALKDSYRP